MTGMSKWAEEQERRRDDKERRRVSRETMGKFFYDLAKLAFAAMSLTGGISLIINEVQIRQIVLLASGIELTYICALIGHRILK